MRRPGGRAPGARASFTIRRDPSRDSASLHRARIAHDRDRRSRDRPRPAAPGFRHGARPGLWGGAAATGGGALLRRAEGGTLLLGTSPAAAQRAATALGTLAGEGRPLPVWQM